MYRTAWFHYTCICMLFLLRCELISAGELVPFSLPWDDSTSSVTDVRSLLETPAGKNGFIQIENGHFVDGAGKRFRIWGVNTAFEGNFPTHEQSEKIAARMAKFGINCVRLHHMDTLRAPSGIWKEGTKEKQILDSGRLDRLDYFIYQLKQNGIYIDINLKVGRKVVDADGFIEANLLPEYDKGPDHYLPRLIELQKNYAHDLLTHVNPYTQRPYSQEPAVAIVEINNESGLVQKWNSGDLDSLPAQFVQPLQDKWNTWLTKKYPDTEALRQAWAPTSIIDPTDLLRGRFNLWGFQALYEAKATPRQTKEGPQGHYAWKVTTTQPGQASWHIQFNYPNLSLKKDAYYRATLWMKADKNITVNVGLMQNHDPWQALDRSVGVAVGAEWKDYELNFSPSQDENNARLNLSGFGDVPCNFWMSDTQLIQDNRKGLSETQSLEARTVLWIPQQSYGPSTDAAQADWMTFLIEQETSYIREMYDYIRQDLGVKSLISGSQLGFGTVLSQMAGDFIDNHGYWQHPSFPGKPWDSVNWYLPNISSVSVTNNTVQRLMAHRIEGYPYTVTEYNHPAPNTFSSEMAPLIAAYGAFQDWDGIFLFAYSHNAAYSSKSINNFFDIAGHTPKMMTFPAAVNLFLRGDVQPAKRSVTAVVPPERYLEAMTDNGGSTWSIPTGLSGFADAAKVLTTVPYLHQFQWRFSAGGQPVNNPAIDLSQDVLVSDTNELIWSTGSMQPASLVIAATDTKGFVGFGNKAPVDLQNHTFLALGDTRQNWANVLLTRMKNDEEGEHWLLTATGYAENKGMIWKNAQKDSVGNQWGSGPPQIEAVPLRLTYTDRTVQPKLFALDERGQRKEDLSRLVVQDSDKIKLELMENPKHLWYEIVFPALNGVESSYGSEIQIPR